MVFSNWLANEVFIYDDVVDDDDDDDEEVQCTSPSVFEDDPLSAPLLSVEIRAQLVEQLKCLDQQCELRVQLLQDLQDFFRKKAEIETEYSRNLEKLAERFMAKTRSTKDHQQYK